MELTLSKRFPIPRWEPSTLEPITLSTKTVEMRLTSAIKMEEAAMVAEAVALAEINSLSKIRVSISNYYGGLCLVNQGLFMSDLNFL